MYLTFASTELIFSKLMEGNVVSATQYVKE